MQFRVRRRIVELENRYIKCECVGELKCGGGAVATMKSQSVVRTGGERKRLVPATGSDNE